MTALASLVITNGTVYIDLLSRNASFKLGRWRSVMPTYKGGGVFRNSPLVDGRRLIDRRYDNIVDTFELNGYAGSQNNLITQLQELYRLCESAADYWTTTWQTLPVWIEARAAEETNIRYALVNSAVMPNGPSPFENPFAACADVIANGLVLTVEHGVWLHLPPGQYEAQPTSTVEPFFDTYYGNVNSAQARQTTTVDQFVGNRRNVAQITHIYRATAAGAFSANLKNGPFPYNLYAELIVNAATYFGVATTFGTGNGPFSSLIFDIGTVSTAGNAVWEYWNGAAWVALTYQDYTGGASLSRVFWNAGVNNVSWQQPSNWATTAVNGVTAWWVRVRITSGVTGNPTQQNRNPYAVVWPYAEVQAADVVGDLPANLEVLVYNYSSRLGDANVTLGVDRVIMGLRSYDRGQYFLGYINLYATNPQNFWYVPPAGATGGVGVTTGANSTNIADATGPTVGAMQWTVAAATTQNLVCSADIGQDLAPSYSGRFRLFVRCDITTGVATDFTLRASVVVGAGGVEVFNAPTSIGSVNAFQVVDLGVINIAPLDAYGTDPLISASIKLYAATTNAAGGVVRFYDFILIPVDEWSGDFVNTNTANVGATLGILPAPYGTPVFLDVDSIRVPKRLIRSVATIAGSSNFATGVYDPRAVGPAMLQANERQRLYLFCYRDRGSGWYNADPAILNRVVVRKVHRYANMRGVR